jgi:hypothetical protein
VDLRFISAVRRILLRFWIYSFIEGGTEISTQCGDLYKLFRERI